MGTDANISGSSGREQSPAGVDKKPDKQPSYLSNHHGESEDTCEIVQQLEDNFKECLGVGQPTNGDEGLHSPVVTANITRERRERGLSHRRPQPASPGWPGSDVRCAKEKTLYSS